MTLRALAALVALGPAAAVLAQEAPTTWAAPAHALTLRDRPGGKPVGALAAGARPIEVGETDRAGVWGRVALGEVSGWVALDALTPWAAPAAAYAPVPLGLLCAGVEPFWSLRFDAAGATLAAPDAAPRTLTVASAAPAAGRPVFPLLLRLGEADAVLRPAACSDGMSDRTDPWTLDLIEAGGLRTGCCRLPPSP